jgi:hypothetical protein
MYSVPFCSCILCETYGSAPPPLWPPGPLACAAVCARENRLENAVFCETFLRRNSNDQDMIGTLEDLSTAKIRLIYIDHTRDDGARATTRDRDVA